MRTLSSLEIARIDQRLESLKIHYLEIYHEIRDHYFTELEKRSDEEFEATFQQLNETFAWSVVKGMEKELRKATSRKIAQLQWDSLTFWKLSCWELALSGILICTFPAIYFKFGLIDLMTATGLISLLSAIAIWAWVAIKSAINFSISRHKPMSCISAELFGRMVFPLSSYSWLYFGAKWISGYNTFWLIDLFIMFLIISQAIFLLTLTKVVFNKKLQVV
ncbi:hypothetical protein [Algoriphagus sp.]|uniref:hypothetical protein n=1 Tax=Algoriphagus sp. TaxID=1872435 RepID=UPI0039198CBA